MLKPEYETLKSANWCKEGVSGGERGDSERVLVVLVLGLLADEEHHGSEKVLFSSGLNPSKVSSLVLASLTNEVGKRTTRASAAILRVS